MRTVTIPEFHQELKAQPVTAREDLAFTCPICGTVQSARSLIAAGAGADMDAVEKYLGFSCVGRWTDAGPHKPKSPAGNGCDWTLGGLFSLHKLEVVTDDGRHQPSFEPATPEQAAALAKALPAQPLPDQGGRNV